MKNPTRPPFDKKILELAKESGKPESDIWNRPTSFPTPILRLSEKRAKKTFDERLHDSLKNWRICTFDYQKIDEQARAHSALLRPINKKLQQNELSEIDARREIEQLGFVIDAVSEKRFDPMASTDWTLLQAIVWIATTSADRIRDVSVDARKRTVRLKSIDPASCFELHWHASLQELPEQQQLEDARKKLWGELRNGTITATGFDAPGVSRKVIPAIEWSDLSLLRDDVVYASARGDGLFRSSDHGYFHVRVSVTDVLKKWPKQDNSSDGNARRGRGNPGEKRRRVRDQMRRDVAGGYDLENAKGVELHVKYGVAIGTCKRAKEEILGVKK
ncbi:hypothetical protein IYX23_07770 [Methylocystis sp. L43]|uniref:hypothetical protein n=1 Tax=unclassified Methylocystis TaxID=2625913 RepID=UPI0018C2414E|nr:MULTISPECIES: hypothetical protein [unclassified Methylocystis]MBG0797564.1 hypothetical protein [Methylocystis sp. L43]MBG0805168.1 hypothetical protein [Methylocystis sp. H15]